MKYYVRVSNKGGEKVNLYDLYHRELALKVDEKGVLKIPEKTFTENGISFRIETNAERVECSYTPISELIANKATYIECNNCEITYLEADKVKKIECNDNPLDFLCVPNAQEIECRNCPLTEINAPQVVKLSFSESNFEDTHIGDEYFPNLEELEIENTNIQVIEHSKLKNLKTFHNKLTRLDLPNVKSLHLESEKNLNELDIPNAEEIFCTNTLLETIIADNTQKIYLDNNNFLKNIFANNLQEIFIYDCHNIENMVIPKEAEIKGISKTMETIFELRR